MRILLSFLFLVSFHCSNAQLLAIFETKIPEDDTSNLTIPVQVNFDNITTLDDSSLALFKTNGGRRTLVPFQVYNNGQRWLCWLMENAGSKKYTYELHIKSTVDNSVKSDPLSLHIKDSTLTISSGNENFLTYVFKTWQPSTGDSSKDVVFRKSGFIHPLYTPHQQEITRVSPPDHFHHYGLWNAWTHVVFEGDTVDCWNLGDRKGTVKFESLLSTTEGSVFSEYKTLHKHIASTKDGSEKTMLNEVQTVRVYTPPTLSNYYILNITIEMTCASESPVLLKEYRYGGLGWRTTGVWDRENSEVLTSEGKRRKEADGSLARWCIVQGKLGNDYGGAVMMSHPANFNHPEPLRIWPEDIFNRGDLFANFSPTKNKDWLLSPRKTYLLRYEFLVFNDHCSQEKAEAAWRHFAHPPPILITQAK